MLCRFLHAEPEDIATFLAKISDKTLRETLSQGVAYMHEGLSSGDKRLVESVQVTVQGVVCSSRDNNLQLIVFTKYF